MPPWCESILGLKAEAVQGKEVSLEWTETSGGLWECGTTLEFPWPFHGPPERLTDIHVVSREQLPTLEKIQEVLLSRRDDSHFR